MRISASHRLGYSWKMHVRCAFTITELMMVIGIIGVLIGITAPALMSVKSAAGQVKSLANLRSIGLTLELYVSQFGTYPYYPAGQSADGSLTYSENIFTSPLGEGTPSTMVFTPVLMLDRFWVGLKGIHDVAPWREHYASWISPGAEHDAESPWLTLPNRAGERSFRPPSYEYSNSFLASPRAWMPSIAVDNATDIRPTRAGDVAHPSSKVIMFDVDRSYIRNALTPLDPRPVLFVDGAAAAKLDTNATSPVQNQLFGNHPRTYHDTPRGVDGLDFSSSSR